MALQVLIVDDDARLFELLSSYLAQNSVVARSAGDGQTALALLERQPVDAVLLDVMMPGLDGLAVLRKIREKSDVPVIMLTAKGDETDRVVGLELGADDYLAKPFSPRELEYRIDALLRRSQGIAKQDGNEDRLEIGDLVVDRRRHEVSRAGEKIDLTPLEFQILDLLASEPGRAWSRNDLLDRVWSTEYEGYQRNIDPHINRLRKKLENDPKNPHYVLTVRGVGYKLNENP